MFVWLHFGQSWWIPISFGNSVFTQASRRTPSETPIRKSSIKRRARNLFSWLVWVWRNRFARSSFLILLELVPVVLEIFSKV